MKILTDAQKYFSLDSTKECLKILGNEVIARTMLSIYNKRTSISRVTSQRLSSADASTIGISRKEPMHPFAII